MKFIGVLVLSLLLAAGTVMAGDSKPADSSTDSEAEPQVCGQLSSNDISVATKQHYFPVRFRKVNGIRVDLRGWSGSKNSAGTLYLEPGKHRLQVYIKNKDLGGMSQESAIIDRQYVDLDVKADMSYELVAYEKQGEERTLQRGHRFKIEVLREEAKPCEGGKIFEAPEQEVASK